MMERDFSIFRARQFAPLAIVIVSTLAAICAYLQAYDYPFIGDDAIYVSNHKLAEQRLNDLWRFFLSPYNSFDEFLPLRDISYWFDIKLFGLNPSAFRMHNIVLYLLGLPFVYGASLGVWRYFRPFDTAAAPWAAAAITALFVLHPSHVEAVVWISGRKDVMAATFSMLALWLAVRAGQEHEFSRLHAVAALIALMAAMLSKVTAAAMAPVIAALWLLHWRDLPKHARRLVLLSWPIASLLLAACCSLIFGAFTRLNIPFYYGIEAVTRSLAALGWIARLSVSPEERHYFYPVLDDPHLPVMVALGLAVLAVTVTGGLMILRRRSLEGFALFVFLLLAMPSIQLVPYAPPSLVSDRFLTVAIWPAILLIVALSWRLNPLPRMALLLAIALAWSVQTVVHPREWRSPEALIDAELRAHPGHYIPAGYKIFVLELPRGQYDDAMDTANSVSIPQVRNTLIKMIRAHHAVQVDAVSTGNPSRAIALLWEALTQRPVETKWNPTLYNIWDQMREQLKIQWKFLGKYFPADPIVQYNAGLWMVRVEKYKDAIPHLRAATESQHLPASLRGSAFENLGLALLSNGQVLEAERPLLTALKLPQPEMRIHCLLAVIYKQTGRAAEEAQARTRCLNVPDR